MLKIKGMIVSKLEIDQKNSLYYEFEQSKKNIYIYGIARNKDELEIVVDEANSILDVNKVIASILLVEDLRIQKD